MYFYKSEKNMYFYVFHWQINVFNIYDRDADDGVRLLLIELQHSWEDRQVSTEQPGPDTSLCDRTTGRRSRYRSDSAWPQLR